jgi:hypothetical protein
VFCYLISEAVVTKGTFVAESPFSCGGTSRIQASNSIGRHYPSIITWNIWLVEPQCPTVAPDIRLSKSGVTINETSDTNRSLLAKLLCPTTHAQHRVNCDKLYHGCCLVCCSWRSLQSHIFQDIVRLNAAQLVRHSSVGIA